MSEFDLINHYFNWQISNKNGVIKAVGDDAAVLALPENTQLITSIDTLISGVHFPENTTPEDIAYKSLAVNLSDLAAMAARPAWFTLALTLPKKNSRWLQGFSAGLKEIATQYGCDLVGGDTTRGSLSISIQVMGWVRRGRALLRSGARPGDLIYVSGTLGDAAIALQSVLANSEPGSLNKADLSYCQSRLNRPVPRLAVSEAISDIASACIDISDGLIQDLSHILKASGVGASVQTEQIPLSAALQKLPSEQALWAALSGGDDYELLFCVPPEKQSRLDTINKMDVPLTCIGEINDKSETICDASGNLIKLADYTGYNHFYDE